MSYAHNLNTFFIACDTHAQTKSHTHTHVAAAAAADCSALASCGQPTKSIF